MNLLAPLSSIMSTHLVTVSEHDPIHVVEEIFRTHNIHHIPVLSMGKLTGILSKTDYNLFLQGFPEEMMDKDQLERYRKRVYNAKDIMTSKIATLEADDNINIALEVFNENRFHAIPITVDGELVGIVTTFDIIKKLSEDSFAETKYS